jgi:hypothetical protein
LTGGGVEEFVVEGGANLFGELVELSGFVGLAEEFGDAGEDSVVVLVKGGGGQGGRG